MLVPREGFEPSCLATGDFKSPVSTIPPPRHTVRTVYKKNTAYATVLRMLHMPPRYNERTNAGSSVSERMMCVAVGYYRTSAGLYLLFFKFATGKFRKLFK